MEPSVRGRFELKQLSDWWFDLSKLTTGSVLVPVFLGNMPVLLRVIIGFSGLWIFTACARNGLKFAQSVKD